MNLLKYFKEQEQMIMAEHLGHNQTIFKIEQKDGYLYVLTPLNYYHSASTTRQHFYHLSRFISDTSSEDNYAGIFGFGTMVTFYKGERSIEAQIPSISRKLNISKRDVDWVLKEISNWAKIVKQIKDV